MTSEEYDAVDRTMGLHTVWDVLGKLEWELLFLRELENRAAVVTKVAEKSSEHPLAALYAGINAASTAWSITDWVWQIIRRDAEKLRLAEHTLAAVIDRKKAQNEFRLVNRPGFCRQSSAV